LKSATVLTGLLSFFLPQILPAQCTSAQPDSSPVRQFYDQHNWAEVVRLAAPLASRTPDVNFDYGLALAHLQQWPQARAALIAGSRPHRVGRHRL
jgi:hypothetical protein